MEYADGRLERVPAGRWLYRQWLSGRAVLIVDGLDEVYDPEDRRKALEPLAASGVAGGTWY